MSPAVELPVIAVFLVVLRILFLVREHAPMADAIGSAFHVERQSRSRWLTYRMPRALKDGLLANSQLVMWMVSRFPKAWRNRVATLQNIVFDVLWLAGVYAAAWSFMPAGAAGIAGLSGPGLVALLFATMPALSPVNARVLGGAKARCFGGFIGFVYVGALYLAVTQSPLWYGAAAVFFGVTVLGSVFATQAMIAVSVGLSLWFLTPGPVLVVAVTLAVGWLVPPLGLHGVMVWKYHHYGAYLTMVKDGSLLAGRNNLREAAKALSMLRSDPLRTLDHFVRHFVPVALVWAAPALVVVPLALLPEGVAGWRALATAPGGEFALAVAASLLAAAVLTGTRPFLFLGESERYMEFATPFVALLTVYALDPGAVVLLALAQAALAVTNFILLNRKAVAAHFGPAIKLPYSPELGTFLHGLKGRMLPIPLRMGRALALMADNDDLGIYQMGVYTGDRFLGAVQEDTAGSAHTFPRQDLATLIDKYAVTHLALNKTLGPSRLYDIPPAKIIYDDAELTIYELCPDGDAPNTAAQSGGAPAAGRADREAALREKIRHLEARNGALRETQAALRERTRDLAERQGELRAELQKRSQRIRDLQARIDDLKARSSKSE